MALDDFDTSNIYNNFVYDGGLYKSTTHLGPDERTFVTIENSFVEAKQSIVYEVKASNHLDAVFKARSGACSDDKNFVSSVACEAGTSPKMLKYDAKEKKLSVIDLLQKETRGLLLGVKD